VPQHAHACESDMKRKIEVESSVPESSAVNTFTGKPYSSKYYEILKGRQGMIPVLACAQPL
jgi:hypothetical protein